MRKIRKMDPTLLTVSTRSLIVTYAVGIIKREPKRGGIKGENTNKNGSKGLKKSFLGTISK